MSEFSQIRAGISRVAESDRATDTCALSRHACQILLVELDRLYTQARAANALTTALRSETRKWRSAGLKLRLDSELAYYQQKLGGKQIDETDFLLGHVPRVTPAE